MSRLFTSGGQNIRASASVLPMNIQDCFPLGWTGWISLLSKGLSRAFSSTTVGRHHFFGALLSLWPNPQSVHVYWDYMVLAPISGPVFAYLVRPRHHVPQPVTRPQHPILHSEEAGTPPRERTQPVSQGHHCPTRNQAKPLPSGPGPDSQVTEQPEGVGISTHPRGLCTVPLGSYTFLSSGPPYPGATLAGPRGRLRPAPHRPHSEPHAPFSLEPPPLWERTGRTGTEPSPLHSEQTCGGPKRSGQNWRCTVRRQTAATAPLLMNAWPRGIVRSHRTGRHPPQQAAWPGATQPCLWPARESRAGLLSEP